MELIVLGILNSQCMSLPPPMAEVDHLITSHPKNKGILTATALLIVYLIFARNKYLYDVGAVVVSGVPFYVCQFNSCL